MSDLQNQAAAEVAEMINDAERAMDVAMAKASRLITEGPALIKQAGLNGAWVQPAVSRVCSALGSMSAARGEIIDAHTSLSAVQRKLGIALLETPDNTKVPDGTTIPKTGRAGETVVPLRA